TDPTATKGSRANPFSTIQAGINAAAAGDMVGVLPGVYTEAITLKPFVRVFSAATSSTDTNFVIGNALQTVIRAPDINSRAGPPKLNAPVTAMNLPTVPGVDTEISGFTIASPLLFDPANGPIDPNSAGVFVMNSNVLIDRSYIIDSRAGVFAVTMGANAPAPPTST